MFTTRNLASTTGFVVDVGEEFPYVRIDAGENMALYMTAILNQLSAHSLKHIRAVGAVQKYFRDIAMKYDLKSPEELRNYLKNSWSYQENITTEQLISLTFRE